MAAEINVVRESSVKPINAMERGRTVNAPIKKGMPSDEFEQAFSEFVKGEGDIIIDGNQYTAEVKSGDVYVDIDYNKENGSLWVTALDEDGNVLRQKKEKSINGAKQTATDMKLDVFAPNERRMYVVNLSDGSSFKMEAINYDSMKDRYQTRWREENPGRGENGYEGMPNIVDYKEKKLWWAKRR